jgi:hypothetical protein
LNEISSLEMMKRIGADQGGWQTTWAAALSRAISDKWGVVGNFPARIKILYPIQNNFIGCNLQLFQARRF